MLVLSRKQDQKVSFPELGISVHILRVKGSSVRVGVDAPLEVRIIRDELEPQSNSKTGSRLPRTRVIRLPRNLRHELRNELNSLSIALHLFKEEMEAGHDKDADATFAKLVEYLERISDNKAFSREGV